MRFHRMGRVFRIFGSSTNVRLWATHHDLHDFDLRPRVASIQSFSTSSDIMSKCTLHTHSVRQSSNVVSLHLLLSVTRQEHSLTCLSRHYFRDLSLWASWTTRCLVNVPSTISAPSKVLAAPWPVTVFLTLKLVAPFTAPPSGPLQSLFSMARVAAILAHVATFASSFAACALHEGVNITSCQPSATCLRSSCPRDPAALVAGAAIPLAVLRLAA